MIIKSYRKFNRIFQTNHTSESLSYLANREFNDDTIKYFEFGYNDDIHIINMPEFENCITTPVHDLKDRIVAFMCRAIDKNAKQKHNSTFNFLPLYEKGRMLFNLNRVLKYHYRRTIFIVEGQFDCASMHQVGFKNTVAKQNYYSDTSIRYISYPIMMKLAQIWLSLCVNGYLRIKERN